MSRIGERHAGDLDGRLSKPAAGLNVVISVQESYARFVSAQHLVWMLINLLARQPEEVNHIELVYPEDIEAPAYLSPLVDSGPFRRCVLEAAGRINSSLTVAPGEGDTVFIRVGSGEHDSDRYNLWVSCDNWSGYVGTEPADTLTDSPDPTGPYVAACLAAGEIFKLARQVKPEAGSAPRRLWLNAYTLRIGEEASYSPDLPQEILFPTTSLAGVGAVGSAFLHLLYALPGCRGDLDVIDGDLEGVTETNLNRYVIFDPRHTEKLHPKASTAARLLSLTSVNLKPFDRAWEEWRADERPVPEIVISAVDNNKARHAIQDSMPRIILGASTNELKLQVNYFKVFEPASACLKCRNAIDTKAIPDDVIIDRLKALHENELQVAAREIEVPSEDLKVFLSDPEMNCGLISGTSLQRFAATSDAGVWSVGFVSVLAGVLLGAEFVKQITAADVGMTPLSNLFRFQFWHPDRVTVNRLTSAQPDASCICRSSYYQAVVARGPSDPEGARQ